MSKENASYYREIESNKEIDGYSYSNYYIDGNIESYGKMAKFNDTRTLNGEITKYHENGEVTEISNYLFGKKEGESFLFYDTGSIKSKINYKNGKKNGLEVKFFESGIISYSAIYKNNMLNGKETFYGTNGQIISEINYKNNKYDGKYTLYTGIFPTLEINYKMGKKMAVIENTLILVF